MSVSFRRSEKSNYDGPSSSTTSTSRRSLSAAGDAHTTGTSWASLRFSKPMPDGYRGHSSRLASTFESPRSTSYNPSTSAATLATSSPSRYASHSTERPSTSSTGSGYVRSALANYQKAVASSETSSRPRTNVSGPLMAYRSQVARDMFSPSRFVPSSTAHKPVAEREPSKLASSYLTGTKTTASSARSPTRSIFSPTRTTYTETERSRSTGRPFSTASTLSTPSTSSYQPALTRVTSSSLVANAPRRPTSTYESDQLSLAVTKALSRPAPRADRPWRQKMADAARLRSLHGDDISSGIVSRLAASRATRRNSQTSGDELQHSLDALKSFVADPAAVDRSSAIAKYRAKNGSLESRDSSLTSARSVPRTTVTPSAVSARPAAGFTSGPTISSTSLRPYRTSGYGKTLAEAQMSESFAGTPSPSVATRGADVMSRSFSPVRSTRSLFESPRNSHRFSSQENVHAEPWLRDRGQTILEDIQERWGERNRRRNPRSSKERTLRRDSRQRSQSREPAKSSSSEEEQAAPDSRDPPRRRRIRKRTASIPKVPPTAAPANQEPLPPRPTQPSTATAQDNAGAAAVVAAPPATVKPAAAAVVVAVPEAVSRPAPASTDPQPSAVGGPKSEMGNKPAKSGPAAALQKVLAPFRRKTVANKSTAPSQPQTSVPPPSVNKAKEKTEGEVVSTTVFARPAPIATTEECGGTDKSVSETTTTATAPTTTAAVLADDESQFDAVTEFRPAPRTRKVATVKPAKQAKPVPGVWQAQDEINISCNRRFTRKAISALAVEAVCRDVMRVKAVPKRVKVSPIKKKKVMLVEKSIQAVFVARPVRESAMRTVPLKRSLLVYRVEASFARPKPLPKLVPVTAVATLEQVVSNKKRLRLGTERVLRPAVIGAASLKCKASRDTVRLVELCIHQKEAKRAANVTVVAVDVMDVNFARVARHLKVPAGSEAVSKSDLAHLIERQAAIVEAERRRLSRTPRGDEDDYSTCSESSRRVETQASIVLSSLRNAAPRLKLTAQSDEDSSSSQYHLPPLDDYSPGGPLVLPDRSVLEEYVRRKRTQLERLQSEPVPSPSRDSPCLSTTSELVQPSAVRILEPHRSVARLSIPHRATATSVEFASLPGSNRNSRMIDLLTFPGPTEQQAAQAGAGGNGFRAALKRPVPRKESLTTQHFDTPKTPFEAAMQSAAAQMVKKASSVHSEDGRDSTSLVEPLPYDSPHHARRPSVESTHSMPSGTGNLAQTFAQAAAIASQPRHERYAAHLPVRQASAEASGRQSTTSIDSANSGALDTAGRQLDQMIDQARYRHHQHRSKFKEAIDYLDQIFEDLKKEVDAPVRASGEKTKPDQTPHVPGRPGGVLAAKAMFQKQTPSVSQPTNVPIVRLRKPSDLAPRSLDPSAGPTAAPSSSVPSTTAAATTTATTAQKNGRVPTSPKRTHQSSTTTAPSTNPTGPKPFPKVTPSASGDVEVTETIVLPTKANPEKMDFTRQWLTGDIKGWAEKPDLIVPSGDLTSPNDSDDRSVGSCSAEVAAINAADRKRRRQVRETPDIIKSSKTAPKKPVVIAPVRPQPVRPQAQYAPFPSAMETSGLQKAPSSEFVNARGRADRAGSQDYQSLGSVHSQDGYKPSSALSLYSNSLSRSGAFQQYPQRGSIHSLPDANLINRPVPSQNEDPILAIDALVAELELNTEQPEQASGKRRSFPTGTEPTRPPRATDAHRGVSSNGLRVRQPVTNGGSMDRSLLRMQTQQRNSLDEMANMLANVAGDLNSSAPARRPVPSAGGTVVGLRRPEAVRPFDTINQERLAPSRVGAMQQMFETKKSNGSEHVSWRRPAPKAVRQEENYYEIQEFSQRQQPSENLRTPTMKPTSPQTPTRPTQYASGPTNSHFPLPQLPSVPPPTVHSGVSSTNSSQHGYYSSSTSSVGRPPVSVSGTTNGHSTSSSHAPHRRGSFAGKHSISSRAASFDDEDEDDGFYDNIQVHEDRRFSELDNTSLASHQLPPPHKQGRLGQLIRRIGGRPPSNASSSLSLNRMGVESNAPLMKSNSLSNEPWRQQVIGVDKRPQGHGLGQRLKQSLFGSRKRL